MGLAAPVELRFQGHQVTMADVLTLGYLVTPYAVDFNADGVPDIVTGAEDGDFYYLKNPRIRGKGL